MCVRTIRSPIQPAYKIHRLPTNELVIVEATEENIMIEDDFYDFKTAQLVLKNIKINENPNNFQKMKNLFKRHNKIKNGK